MMQTALVLTDVHDTHSLEEGDQLWPRPTCSEVMSLKLPLTFYLLWWQVLQKYQLSE